MSTVRPDYHNGAHITTPVVLLLQVPRANDKKELAAEQMFASLHGLLTVPPAGRFKTSKRTKLSFEIAVLKRRIGFYVCVERYLVDYVQEQLYAQYPNVQISEVEDYAVHTATPDHTTLSTELTLTSYNALPIKTFLSFEVDPLAAITATLAKFDEDEEAWIQLVIRPASKNWHKKHERYVSNLRGQTKTTGVGVISALWSPPSGQNNHGLTLTEFEQSRARSAEEKSHKLAYEATIRIIYRGRQPEHQAALRLQSIVASYKQFNTTYLNGFKQGKVLRGEKGWVSYKSRLTNKRPSILNIEEVATLYHLPHTTVETPFILWSSSQTGEPPANLPVVTEENVADISPIARANFRGYNSNFGLPRSDRGRHLYIVGQTGVGKSGSLELLTIADIENNHGFAVIDPHGDYALSILRRIPESRLNDVLYFNPADVDFPIAFNPMEISDSKLKTHTVSEIIGVLKRLFDSWGPRLEYILRHSLLALIEYPDATMLDITRILTERKFRQTVLEYVTDPVVKNFWMMEFAAWNDKFAAEAIAPVLNKVGAFTANPLVRNIVGQPKSSFSIRDIMDNKKIILINLNRGLVGEDNAALLGALFVTNIQLAAMGRADQPANERIPFYLYVDEFQHFATDSFANILSEARKYGLNLTVANQYISQMSLDVKDAVFGNVGSIIAFRVGADDAKVLHRYFEPKFIEYDLVHMHNRHLVTTMTIEGEKVPAFSAVTLDLPERPNDLSETIIANSRNKYSTPRLEVEARINLSYTAPKKTPPIQKLEHKIKPIRQSLHAVSIVVGRAATLKSSVIEHKTKRKRKRNRKRKPTNLTAKK